MHITHHICPPCPLKQPVAVHVMIHIAFRVVLIDHPSSLQVEGLDLIYASANTWLSSQPLVDRQPQDQAGDRSASALA